MSVCGACWSDSDRCNYMIDYVGVTLKVSIKCVTVGRFGVH
jgi:hypothetical protein